MRFRAPTLAAIALAVFAALAGTPGVQAQDEGGWADAGHGTIPWKTLWPIIRTKTRAGYFIAEHDNPNDIDRLITRSIAAFNSY